jgi:TRAP-type uncharacterized transport system substrate-binding protein
MNEDRTMKSKHPHRIARIPNVFTDLLGLNRTIAISIIVLIIGALGFSVYWFIHLAPPRTITITSGPEKSIYWRQAERYAKILARNGVTLKILPSQGSLDNLKRLSDPKVHVDIGFVQGGIAKDVNTDSLVSLGSLYSSPILVFYRSTKPIELLSQLSGKRLALGPEGSGSRTLAMALLAANGIEPGGASELSDLDADDAAQALLDKKIDAVFLMGESAPGQVMRALLRTPNVRLYSFTQADAYTRRMVYLSKLQLPEGSIDFGKNIPDRDVDLVAPTVELLAREGLHPALSDLLLEAAREIHGRAGLFRKQGEFPAPLEHEYRLSEDALRYYKSGKSFLYRSLPFWVASMANRFLVVFVPMIVILIPVVRSIPIVYKWKIRLGIYKWYRALLALERDMRTDMTAEKRDELLGRLDMVEKAVNKMRVPASFADQFYILRGHVEFVRERLISGLKTTEA